MSEIVENKDIINILKKERLHIRLINDTIDVLYRPNHTYLLFLKNDEIGRQKVKELALMSRDEFKNFLKTISFLPNYTKDMEESIKTSKLEEWYLGAWSMQTKKLLNEIGVENPIEEPIYTIEI